jgi:hypothetical protein
LVTEQLDMTELSYADYATRRLGSDDPAVAPANQSSSTPRLSSFRAELQVAIDNQRMLDATAAPPRKLLLP